MRYALVKMKEDKSFIEIGRGAPIVSAIFLGEDEYDHCIFWDNAHTKAVEECIRQNCSGYHIVDGSDEYLKIKIDALAEIARRK